MERASRLKRELSDEAVTYQAEALASYARRGGGVSRWLDSRDLLPGDREAILSAWARGQEGSEGAHKGDDVRAKLDEEPGRARRGTCPHEFVSVRGLDPDFTGGQDTALWLKERWK